MKKIAILLAMVSMIAASALLIMVPAGAAPEDVCPGTKVDVEDLPATIEGVEITLVSSTEVNFNIEEGTTVTVCVKAGSEEQGDGPETHVLTEDTTLTHSTLKDLSHVSVISVTSPTTATTEPPTEPTASLTTPNCENQNIVATGVNPTSEEVTFDVFIDGLLVDSFIVAADSQGTSALIPVTHGDVVTVTVQGSTEVLATLTVNLNCQTTSTQPPPPSTSTPPPPPPSTSTQPPPPPSTSTQPPPPPPDDTETPPPVQGPGPGGPGPGGPPVQGPPTTAFTGPEDVVPLAALALALLLIGSGTLWVAYRRSR